MNLYSALGCPRLPYAAAVSLLLHNLTSYMAPIQSREYHREPAFNQRTTLKGKLFMMISRE